MKKVHVFFLALVVVLVSIHTSAAKRRYSKQSKIGKWSDITVCHKPVNKKRRTICTTVGELSRYAPDKAVAIADVVEKKVVKVLKSMKRPPVSLKEIQTFERLGIKHEMISNKLLASGELFEKLLGRPSFAGCTGEGQGLAGVYLTGDPVDQAGGTQTASGMDAIGGGDCRPGVAGIDNGLTVAMGGYAADLSFLYTFFGSLHSILHGSRSGAATPVNQAGQALPASGDEALPTGILDDGSQDDDPPGDDDSQDAINESGGNEGSNTSGTNESTSGKQDTWKFTGKDRKRVTGRMIIGRLWDRITSVVSSGDNNQDSPVSSVIGIRGFCFADTGCGGDRKTAIAVATAMKVFETNGTCTNPRAAGARRGSLNPCWSILNKPEVNEETMSQFWQDACGFRSSMMGSSTGGSGKDNCSQLGATMLEMGNMATGVCNQPDTMCAPETSVPPGAIIVTPQGDTLPPVPNSSTGPQHR